MTAASAFARVAAAVSPPRKGRRARVGFRPPFQFCVTAQLNGILSDNLLDTSQKQAIPVVFRS